MTDKPYYVLTTAALDYDPAANLYRSKDGHYYQHIEDIHGSARAKYRKVFSPYYSGEPILGKRAETILIDDVETPNHTTKELQEKLEKWFLYGIDDNNQKVNIGLIKKEKEVEIGGNNCHLCGASILQNNVDTVYKKRVHRRTVVRYECGTVVEKSFKSRGEGYEMENKKQKVILGDDCVEV